MDRDRRPTAHPISLSLTALGVLLLGVLASNCNKAETAFERLSLLSSGRPDIVTENRIFEPPPSLGGNRFVSGWWPWKKGDETLFVSVKDTIRLGGVSIADSTRQLRLEGEILEAPEGATIELLLEGRSVGRAPLTFPLELELPTDLSLGRFPIDLRLSPQSQIAVRSAAMRGALPAGEVAFGTETITQSGYSLVDYSLPVAAGTLLEATFEPPANARPEQRFEVWIERQGVVPEKIFSWPRSFRDRLFGGNRIRTSLGDDLVRIRFAALGEGPPGIWTSPTLLSPDKPELTTRSVDTKPPKLVLVYVMDALRADHLGHLGGPDGVSPTLDRLASQGATLLDHYSVAPNTFPSIKSLFLGRAPRYDGGWKVPPDGETTLAERFQRAGYRTGLFSGNALASAIYGTDRGFDYVAEDVVMRGLGPNGYSDNGEQIHRAVLDWLQEVPVDEKVFLYLQTLHPHNPYMPPPALEQAFTAGIDSSIEGSSSVLLDIKHGRLEPTTADRDRLRALYAASVRYNDDLIAELLADLERRYSPGEMLFIATSDHGDELFDHGGLLHGYTLYEEQIHIPAVFWWPGTVGPCQLQTPSDHLDLQLTLRALIEDTTPAGPGRSLWPEIQECNSLVGRHHLRFAAASSLKDGIFLARSADLKYIWAPRLGQGGGPGRTRDGEYLFDLASDPGEMTNLAGEVSLAADWLRSELLAWIESDPARSEEQEKAVIDTKERDRLKALGYLD